MFVHCSADIALLCIKFCRQAHVVLYDRTVYTCVDLQATQRRLACHEVAQLINCAVDDFLGTRCSGHDPDPHLRRPTLGTPFLAQQRVNMAPRTTEVLLGIMESLKGTGTAALGLERWC